MNISMIAQLAEVSTATVSRYLNNGYVSEQKRKRIQAVIEQTGYTPSSSTQTLLTGKCNLIGVIVPKISSESVSRMVDGITEVVNNAGYQVLLANTGNNTEREMEYLKTFRLNNVDGVIFIGTLMTKKHLALMKSYKKPIVLMGQQESDVSCVYFDDYGAAKLATDCLVRCGCQNIVHLGVTLKDKAAGRARRGGYLDTLEENLDYIANALGNKGTTSREVIRNYFVNDFFKDHCQTYSVTGSGKRPIYWLFDSGKQNGFKALVYLHRYTPDTIGTLRVDYLHKMQRVYESEINRMQDMMDHTTNAREAAAAAKRKDKLTKQLKECRDYDEKISHLALSRIALDLDDGVKVNYRKLQTAADGKFYEVLADSKNIMAKEKK